MRIGDLFLYGIYGYIVFIIAKMVWDSGMLQKAVKVFKKGEGIVHEKKEKDRSWLRL